MEYGQALPPTFQFVPFWARKDLKKNPFQQIVLYPTDRVMDCGAHVGMFTVACLEQGVASVQCYEPAPKNADRLRINTEPYGAQGRVTIKESALVPHKCGPVMLRLSGFDGAHQLQTVADLLQKDDAPRTVSVSTTPFRPELLAFGPSVLKIDVEGAEYELLDALQSGDLDSVRWLFVEFHPYPDREERIRMIRLFLKAEGFALVNTRPRSFIATRQNNPLAHLL